MTNDQKQNMKTSAGQTKRTPRPRQRKTKPKGFKSVILMGFIEFHYDD